MIDLIRPYKKAALMDDSHPRDGWEVLYYV